MPHDHGSSISPDACQPQADSCPSELVDQACGCQDVHYACGYVDREHDHVMCMSNGTAPEEPRV